MERTNCSLRSKGWCVFISVFVVCVVAQASIGQDQQHFSEVVVENMDPLTAIQVMEVEPLDPAPGSAGVASPPPELQTPKLRKN